tara:strand:+ start:3654 stop:4085 length:432 start_codon:yes stop_codon:yes gene_type:complete
MDKKTLESKIKRSVQVLLYLFELKTNTKIDSARNFIFNYWNSRDESKRTYGSVYFTITLKGSCEDPDPNTLCRETDRVFDMVYDFFKTQKLDDETISFIKGEEPDDMVGLFLRSDFTWNDGMDDNVEYEYGFEYNFYGLEITE